MQGLGAGGRRSQGTGGRGASEERVLQASYNISIGQPSLGMIMNRPDKVDSGPSVRSGKASEPPTRLHPPIAIGPVQVMLQSGFQTPVLTRSTDAPL